MMGYFTPTTQGITIPSISKSEIIAIEKDHNESSPGPLKFAQPHEVSINACNDGKWDGNTWVLYVESPGARSLNFGFKKLELRKGAVMKIKSTLKDSTTADIEVDAKQVNDNGEYWTKVLNTDQVKISIEYPGKYIFGPPCDDFELGFINVGFRSFTGDKSGSCNIDVVCPLREGWESEIKSVAGIAFSGSLFCTGAMINNANNDGTPYFLTAYHCGIRNGNVGSLVTYWNYETSVCDGTPDGSLDQYTTGGGVVLAWNSPSDMTLVRLNNRPDSDYGVTFAGWDNTPGEYSLPGVCIHHPSGDEKRISFEYDAMQSTSYGGSSPIESGTHVKVIDWDEGTTEPGSSGSPLFNGNHHIIGQLHGGSAACGNDLPDWYGRFSLSWSATNMGDYLDPQDTLEGGFGSVDTYDPYAFPTISPKPTNTPTFPLPTTSPTACAGIPFKLDLLTDNYGGEISWTLTDLSDDDVIHSVPQDTYGDATRYEVDKCLDFGCYRFDIYDSYNDGICCGYGEGEYIITANGVVVGSGGEYDYSDNVPFCYNSGDSQSPTASSENPSTVSPTVSPTVCHDSSMPLFYEGNNYSCQQLSSENRCVYDLVQSHCPQTCNACLEYKCEDSKAPVQTNSGIERCSDYENISTRICQNPKVYTTCRKKCKICDV